MAIVLAGHNGSGKSTLWYQQLADSLKMPLVNADRITLSLLPEADSNGKLRDWVIELRDSNEAWQRVAQESVRVFLRLLMERQMPFAFETVFSHLKQQKDGTFESKVDLILDLQTHGYFVILLFVGLSSADLSIFRVATRKAKGGHSVPENKLRERFPRTQKAVGMASKIADVTLMFDNSRNLSEAFSLARVQRKSEVIYDCRRPLEAHY
ncbi:MAG: hypothetical protein NW208_07395 [Bryobacter sp.]|nr:hypothetical protein [Bryobacter sp.]